MAQKIFEKRKKKRNYLKENYREHVVIYSTLFLFFFFPIITHLHKIVNNLQQSPGVLQINIP